MIPGPLHYEMVAVEAVFVLLGLAFPVWVCRARMSRGVVAVLAYVSSLWVAFAVGFWGLSLARQTAARDLGDDIFGVVAAHIAIFAVVDVAILWLIHWRWPVSLGPYCPRCNYCLVGAPDAHCPECGRAFTMAELGVTADELRADSPPAAQ